jgi:uncharacterized Zn finger protein (UPF0148 family)
MFGPIGLGLAAARAVTAVVCPHCKATLARSRWSAGQVTCRSCRRRFDVSAAARAKAPGMRRR